MSRYVHKSVLGGQQGIKQSDLVIIDGRKSGLEYVTFLARLRNAQRDEANSTQVKVLLPGGIIREWPE